MYDTDAKLFDDLLIYCQSQKKTGKFVSGCSNFRIDTIQANEVSEHDGLRLKYIWVQDVFTC